MIPNLMNPMGLSHNALSKLPRGYKAVSRIIIPEGAYLEIPIERDIVNFNCQYKSDVDATVSWVNASLLMVNNINRSRVMFINPVKNGDIWYEARITYFMIYNHPLEVGEFANYRFDALGNHLFIFINDTKVASKNVPLAATGGAFAVLFKNTHNNTFFKGEVGKIFASDIEDVDIFDLQGCIDTDGLVCFYDYTTQQTHYSKGIAFELIS